MHATHMQCNIGDQGRLIDGVRLRQVVPGIGLKRFAVSSPRLAGQQQLQHSIAVLANVERASQLLLDYGAFRAPAFATRTKATTRMAW